MAERPILFSSEMVRAILDGRKTQTRRPVKYLVNTVMEYCFHLTKDGMWEVGFDYGDGTGNFLRYIKCPYGQPGDRLYVKEKYFVIDQSKTSGSDILYGILDDSLYGILLSEVKNGKYKVVEWNFAEVNSYLSERRLHGGIGWSDLLTDNIQGLWAEGIRGLVSARRTHDEQGLPEYFSISRKQESNKICTPAYLHGFPRIAPFTVLASSALGQQSSKQFAGKLSMGNANRQLGGQKIGWAGDGRGKTPDGKTNQFRDASLEMGDRKGIGESETSSEGSWNVSGWDICRCSSEIIKWKPSIFMPRWASRINLEITNIRVERVQDISEANAASEGVIPSPSYSDSVPGQEHKFAFRDIWFKINGVNSWESNPWVWIIEFKRIDNG